MLTFLVSLIGALEPAREDFATAHLACIAESVVYLPDVPRYLIAYHTCVVRRQYGF